MPIEVIPLAHVAVLKQLQSMGGQGGLRMGKEKMGPTITGWRGRGRGRYPIYIYIYIYLRT